jgi:O-antigen ligase
MVFFENKLNLSIFNNKILSGRDQLYFIKIPSILLSALPILLVSGPFLSDLAVVVIDFIFLTLCIKKKNFNLFSNKYFFFFLVFWIYLLFNSIYINFTLDAVRISFFFLRFPIFIFAAYFLLFVNSKFIFKYFFLSLLVIFSILIIDGFYQYFNSVNLFGMPISSTLRVSSLFGNELILGSFISRLMPLLFAISFINLKINKLFKYLLFTIFVFSEVLVFISGERSSFFFINLSGLFIIMFSSDLKKIRLFLLITSLSLIVLLSYFYPTAKNRIIDLSIKQMNIEQLLITTKKTQERPTAKDLGEKIEAENLLKDHINVIYFTPQHTAHYISAFRMFLDHKWFGVGIKNFQYLCDLEKYKFNELSCGTHPHNFYIQLLAELGIIGFSFGLFFISYFIYLILKNLIYSYSNKKKLFNDFQVCLLSGILITIWPLAPSGNIFNNWLNIIFFLYIPFYLWSKSNKKKLN